MININKRYKIGGTGPFTYVFSSADPEITFEPISGTTDDLVDVIVGIPNNYLGTSFFINLNVSTKDGCNLSQQYEIPNPCATYTIDTALLFTYPDTYTVPPNSLNIKTYKWRVGANLEIVGPDNQVSVKIKEKSNSASTTHSVTCEITSAEGCSTILYGLHQTCNTTVEPFRAIALCGNNKALILGNIDFSKGWFKYAEIDFKYYLKNSACIGCEFNWGSLSIITGGGAYVVDTNKNGLITLYDLNYSNETTYSYTIQDNCGKIYNGIFRLPGVTCQTTGGCFTLPSLVPVHVQCEQINENGQNQTLTCGQPFTGDEYFVYTSNPIYGSVNPTNIDWSSFEFLLPTNNGNPIPGYSLSANRQCMITPYGIMFINTNHEIVYAITRNPPFNANISETIEYRVYDNTPARCVSEIGSSVFIHTCIGDPVTEPIVDCATCLSSKTIDIKPHVMLAGLVLTSIGLDLTGVNTNLVSITADNANGLININSSLLSGNITFKYNVTGTKQSTPNTTKTSNWSTVSIDFTCAGTSQSIVVC